jgi:soluble lytic murein transglycosylase
MMNIPLFDKLYKGFSLTLFLTSSLYAVTPSQELASCKSALLAQLNEQKRLPVKGCPVSQKLILWLGTLRDPSQFSPQELTSFFNSHQEWPQHAKLCGKAEEVIAQRGTASEILNWFGKNPPQTPEGVMAYAKTLRSQKQVEKANKVISTAWRTMDLSKADEKKILSLFGHFLQEKDHIARVQYLLWNEDVEAAKRNLNHVPVSIRKIAEVRIAFLGGRPDALQKMKALPANSQLDEGLLYEATKWHRKKGNFQDAANILIKTSSSTAHADKWWKERNYIAREFMGMKKYTTAHDVIKKNGLTPDTDSYSDAKWLMGWLDLRFRKNPNEARQHFESMFSNVEGAISKARAAYWVGRVYEDQGNLTMATKWYKQGAHYKTTYYGQLAAAKIKEPAYPALASNTASSDEKKRFDNKELVKAAYILKGLGAPAKHELNKFLLQIGAQAKTKSERELSVHLAHALAPKDVVWAAKKAGYAEPVLLRKAFPTYAIPKRGQTVPEEAFVMAVIYQETRFDPSAISSAGAMGLMQLLPETASHEAKRLGVKNSKNMLLNPQHNLFLGTAHLSRMLNNFDNSYLLTAIAYNAGPNVARRWVKELGDPRSGKVDIIDWVELIPYYETRNYVMRVLENVTNYRSLQGKPKQTLVQDLKR